MTDGEDGLLYQLNDPEALVALTAPRLTVRCQSRRLLRVTMSNPAFVLFTKSSQVVERALFDSEWRLLTSFHKPHRWAVTSHLHCGCVNHRGGHVIDPILMRFAIEHADTSGVPISQVEQRDLLTGKVIRSN